MEFDHTIQIHLRLTAHIHHLFHLFHHFVIAQITLHYPEHNSKLSPKSTLQFQETQNQDS